MFSQGMYSSMSRHVPEYRRWSNYKGYNEPARFTSPLVDGEMNKLQFIMHIENDILGANLNKADLERTFKRLFNSIWPKNRRRLHH